MWDHEAKFVYGKEVSIFFRKDFRFISMFRMSGEMGLAEDSMRDSIVHPSRQLKLTKRALMILGAG